MPRLQSRDRPKDNASAATLKGTSVTRKALTMSSTCQTVLWASMSWRFYARLLNPKLRNVS